MVLIPVPKVADAGRKVVQEEAANGLQDSICRRGGKDPQSLGRSINAALDLKYHVEAMRTEGPDGDYGVLPVTAREIERFTMNGLARNWQRCRFQQQSPPYSAELLRRMVPT